MRHLVIPVIYSLVLCRLSATQETATRLLIIDDSEDFDPYDNQSCHPILQAHLEGPEDNLQSSLFASEPQEESAQRKTEAAIESSIETANNLEQQLEAPTIKIESSIEPLSSETSDSIGQPDQQIDAEPPGSAPPENVEEQPATERSPPAPSEQIYLEQPTSEQPAPGETPLEQSFPEQTPTEQRSHGQSSSEEIPLEQQPSQQPPSEQPPLEQTPILREELIEKSSLESKVSKLEERIERQATTDQPTSINNVEPTPIQPNLEAPSQIVAVEKTNEHQSSPNAFVPTSDKPQNPPDVIGATASDETLSPPLELAASEMPKIKSTRPPQINPGRIPMKESSHQYSPEISDPSDTLKPKSSLYEDEDDDDQSSMFSDVTPKMAIFSGLTIMSLAGGMIYQLMLKDGNKPLVQSSNHTNVTKSTNLTPTPAQNLKDREIIMLEKKIKLLERKLQLAPLQATLRELKSKNIDSRLSESKSFLKRTRQYQCKLDENRKLKSEVVADRYERLLQIRNLQDINKIPGVIRYIDYHKRVENREMNICEMQAEDEFLREQIDLFRELVSEFEREYSSLNEEINRVKAEGLNLERERSSIAVN